MQSPDKEAIRRFLIEANRAGYGNPDTPIEKSEDGGNLIRYEAGGWRFRDHFYGGQPYSGQEVIYQAGKPVWAMQYRGWILSEEVEAKRLYDFLRQALLQAPEAHPYRGPSEHRVGDLAYLNEWSGDIANFNGRETIVLSEREIYQGRYFGGLVDIA